MQSILLHDFSWSKLLIGCHLPLFLVAWPCFALYKMSIIKDRIQTRLYVENAAISNVESKTSSSSLPHVELRRRSGLSPV